MAYENAVVQWKEGERRLADAAPEHVQALERVTQRVLAELRRRLGGPFTIDELVGLYEQGTGWCLELAYKATPGAPWAWEERTVADAAFARYQREASDYAGGRRLERTV